MLESVCHEVQYNKQVPHKEIFFINIFMTYFYLPGGKSFTKFLQQRTQKPFSQQMRLG